MQPGNYWLFIEIVMKAAYPSQSVLWPVNKKPQPITVEGVIDPDGDDVTITVIGITCNEPITVTEAYGFGTNTAWVVADRLGEGEGRTYVINFVASDGKGGICWMRFSICASRSGKVMRPKYRVAACCCWRTVTYLEIAAPQFFPEACLCRNYILK